ncbi:hypothetical protein [Micromonospora sp. WMMD998]|nr:hypothetical protein [Micromonospora sp. WMMD998]WFE41384.1 hypothetical protein O7619_24185 [Micromonospora sp. WMMD998]
MGERTNDESPGDSFVSAQDIEDADDILFARLVKATVTGPDER